MKHNETILKAREKDIVKKQKIIGFVLTIVNE
jgi:hypothetical protein